MAGFSVETVAAAKFFSINGDDQALEGRMEIAHVLSYPAMEECGPMMAKMMEKVCARGTPLGILIQLPSHSD